MVNKSGKRSGRRDPAAARERILDAATEAFAGRGFAGARVDRIAAAAGLNKRMLYHYFGDKRGLYRAVLERCRPRAGAAADSRTVRLLLWALLEPDGAADLDDRLAPGLGRRLEAGVGALVAHLLDGAAAARAPKPRIRLRRRRP